MSPKFPAILAVLLTIVNSALMQVPDVVVETGHPTYITAAVFAPRGEIVATAAADGTVKLWSTLSGRQIRPLFGENRLIETIAFSPDGKYLAAGGRADSVKLWNVATGSLARTFSIDARSSVDSLVFSRNGRSLIAANSGTIRVWDVANGEESAAFDCQCGIAYALALSPDGTKLAAGSYDRTVRLWDVSTGRLVRSYEGHEREVVGVAFSPDGRLIASSSKDGTARVWDAASGALLTTLMKAVDDFSPNISFADRWTLLTSGDSLEFWNVTTGRRLFSLKAGGLLAMSPDRKHVLAGSSSVEEWDLDQKKKTASLEGPASEIKAVALSPDGHMLAVGGVLALRLWDLSEGRQTADLPLGESEALALAFSPDGTILAAAGDEGCDLLADEDAPCKSVSLWDVHSGVLLRRMVGHRRKVFCIAFSPNGAIMASGSGDATIKLWDVATGKLIRSLEVASELHGNLEIMKTLEVFGVDFSPDGKMLASANRDRTIQLWDVNSGNVIRSFAGHTERVTSVAFTKDGNQVVSGSWDKSIKIWDISSGRLIESLQAGLPSTAAKVFGIAPGFAWRDPATGVTEPISSDGVIQIKGSMRGQVDLDDFRNGDRLASLVSLKGRDWVVTDPKGRFDTDQDLGSIRGIHWLMPDEPLTPLPVETFMRQYFEPSLLARILKCAHAPSCDGQFRPVTGIDHLKRVQPAVHAPSVPPSKHRH